MRLIGLFSGIGGFELAATWLGWEIVAMCEMRALLKAKNQTRKLTDDQVQQIRNMRIGGKLLREIAQAFGVTEATISAICSGKTR